MIKDREKGLISIFLALILVPTYLLTVTGIDISRIYAGKNYLRLANESALSSILLNYDKNLHDKYKLLAVTDMQEANNISRRVMEAELLVNQDGENDNFHTFSKPKIDLKAMKGYSLINPEELERQIIDNMKYKGPIDLLNGFIETLDSLDNAKVYNSVLEKKLVYNKDLERVNENIKPLAKLISQYQDKIEEVNKDYKSFIKDYLQLKKQLEDKSKDHDKISKDFIAKYSKLLPIFNEALSISEKIENKLQAMENELSGLQNSLKEWKNSINKVSSSDLKKQLNSEYTFTNKTFSKENISKMTKNLQKDKKTLEDLKKLLFAEGGQISNLKESPSKFLGKVLSSADLSSYKLVNIKEAKLSKALLGPENKVKVDKNKKEEAKALRKTLTDFNKEMDLEAPKKDSIYNYISEEEYKSIIDFLAESKTSDLASITTENVNENLKKYNFSFDFSSKEVFNNFLIAQYIADKFSDKTIDIGDKITSQKEYIAFGSENLDANIKKARNLVFVIRLAINSMYGFTSPDVRKDALMLATAIVGWTGIGVPLMEALIVSSMALGESILDTGRLSDGENLGIFKNKATWTFSVRGLKRLAQEKSIEFAKAGIENIMDSLEQVVIEAENKSFESLDKFISQTSSSIIQSLTGSVIIPIQNVLVDLLNGANKDYTKEINDLFSDLRSSLLNTGDERIDRLIGEIISYLEENYKGRIIEILKKDDPINNDLIIDLIEEMNKKIEEKVKDFNKKIEDELRNRIASIVDEKTDQYRSKIREAIDSYLEKYTPKSDNKLGQFAKSGLSISYSDYLKLFTFMELNGPNKHQILKRMALIIDIEMKEKTQGFSIKTANTGFRINSSVDIPIVIEIFASKDKKRGIEDELEISFEK